MFCHLHVHTEYSLLDGMCRIPQLVARTREMGMDSLALTDHGVMYGAIQFYQAAREAGIKPIIGCEMYVAPESRLTRTPGDKSKYHLVLLAKNDTGYHNLLRLTSKAHLEGFYYKPKVDRELLEQYREGLVALSACISGEIPQLILTNRPDQARDAAMWYRSNFKDFYLEIQRHPMPELEKVNQGLLAISRELGIPIVATNDAHYINREDARSHDLLLCIGTNSTVSDESRIRMAGDFFYLKSPQEMEELYSDIPEAIENTGRIAAMCNLDLQFGRRLLPEIDLPPEKSAQDYLSDLCWQGLPRYYPDPSQEIKDRLTYELDVIAKTQFANYFLVVWDIVSFTRKAGILFGVRGSAAASIVLRCLGITEIDPIAHRLVFERFLNIERKEMPDIDLDFQDDRRDEVIKYVTGKYGQDHVAQIITFGTLGARAALRDVGRALGMAYGTVDRVARLIPFGVGMTLDKALTENAELKGIYDSDKETRNLIDSAKKVEGISRHASTHAAGVVISRDPLDQHVPLQKVAREGEMGAMTQFGMEDVARVGLLKMDFLGLSNLTILARAREIIRESGVEIDLYRLPMDDEKTFKLLASGETAGVFQLEGAGMRRYIKDLKPTTFSDIAAMVALYRPGPMEHIPTFIKSKHGEEPVHYPHPALASILEETYGVIVYQDQVLFIVREFAGYSLGQADIFRKAMGKKIAEVLKKEKGNFLSGAEKLGFERDMAETIFALIEPFAGYAFNKAHSVSYAFLAYQTAYLKANFPVEYMTALLTTYGDQTEKVASATGECRRLGIAVLPPDINHSRASFAIERRDNGEQAIRFGLASIKNVGGGAVGSIISERERGGQFKSIDDFCQRCDLRGVNRRVLESLIKAGAFDSLGERGSLLASVGNILSLAQRTQKLRDTGQATMFDMFGETAAVPMPSLSLEKSSVTPKEVLGWERELMGVCLSEHPFSAFAGKAPGNAILCGQIDAEMVGQSVVAAGMVSSVSFLFTRDHRPFASAVLEDLNGQVEVMVWPKVFESTKELWQEGNALLVEGKVRLKDERLQLNCDSVSVYQPEESRGDDNVAPVAAALEAAVTVEPPVVAAPPASRHLVIRLEQTDDKDGDIARLHQLIDLLRANPGRDAVSLNLDTDEGPVSLRLPDNTNYCDALHVKLMGLVGEKAIRIDGAVHK